MIDADKALLQVKAQAMKMASVDAEGERGYAHLGWLLLEVADMQYWRVQYDTFSGYLKSIAQITKKTPGQMLRYLHTVRDLCGTFTIEQLETMGITKSMRLRTAQDYAIVLPSDIIQAALDSAVTVQDLKKLISIRLKMPDEPGDWLNLECEFMVTAEQRALLEQAVDVAAHTEPLTKSTIPKSAQMLDIMLKFAQEFLGAHTGDGV